MDSTPNYHEVRLHYERSAEGRNRRLHAPELNAAQVNHRIRARLIERFLRKVGPVADGVDVGTGTGVWAEVLAERCARVVGIDFAENNINVARTNAAAGKLCDRLSYLLGDAQLLKELNNDSYDVATHISVLQHLPDREAALRRVNGVLKENGQLVILVHNRSCIYNRSLIQEKKQGVEIAINEYQSLGEIREWLVAAGFQIEAVGLCWFCLNDLLLLGASRALLKPLMPLRKALITLAVLFDGLAGHLLLLSPFFREIVVLAKKRGIPTETQTRFYQDLWQNEIDNVIGDDYQDYETKLRQKPKMKLLEAYLAAIPEKRSILEIGCGSGRVLSHFKNQFDIEKGYGADISEKAVSFAREHHKDCQFFVCNIDKDVLPYKDGEVDVVLLCDIVEHVTDVKHLLREAVRVGKHVVIKVPLERTLVEYVKTLLGQNTSINRRHIHGHIHSFSQGYFNGFFRELAGEMEIQVEMTNARSIARSRYRLLNSLIYLLKSTSLYRFVFTTELGIHVSRAVR